MYNSRQNLSLARSLRSQKSWSHLNTILCEFGAPVEALKVHLDASGGDLFHALHVPARNRLEQVIMIGNGALEGVSQVDIEKILKREPYATRASTAHTI